MYNFNAVPSGILSMCLVNQKLQYHIVNLIGEEIVSASFNSRKDAFVFARIVGMDLVLNEMK